MRRIFRAAALALMLATLAPAQVSAQDDSRGGDWNQGYDPYVASVGFAVGYASGTGLAFRWPAFPQTMVSVAGGAWGKQSELKWNLGVEAHYILRQAGRMRLFVGPALALYSVDQGATTSTNVGAQVGLEVLIKPRWALKADVGFTWLGEREEVLPLPQASLLFYW